MSRALAHRLADRATGDRVLARLQEASTLLQRATTIQQAKIVADVAAAQKVFAQRQKLGDEVIAYAHEIRTYALARLGELLKVMPKATGARGVGPNAGPERTRIQATTYSELGLDKKTAHAARTLARLPKEKVHEIATRASSVSDVMNRRDVHVEKNSGFNEWYTPMTIIEAARRTMGEIDLDPASSTVANEVIKASRFFTVKDDGLKQDWSGRVWLNPPYLHPTIERFVERLMEHVEAHALEAAIMLANNATETQWFQCVAAHADAVCFPSKRIQFWTPDRETTTPLQGQAAFYFGDEREKFRHQFIAFGVVYFNPRGFKYADRR